MKKRTALVFLLLGFTILLAGCKEPSLEFDNENINLDINGSYVVSGSKDKYSSVTFDGEKVKLKIDSSGEFKQKITPLKPKEKVKVVAKYKNKQQVKIWLKINTKEYEKHQKELNIMVVEENKKSEERAKKKDEESKKNAAEESRRLAEESKKATEESNKVAEESKKIEETKNQEIEKEMKEIVSLSQGFITKIEPYDAEYNSIRIYVLQDIKYVDDNQKMKVMDSFGGAVQRITEKHKQHKAAINFYYDVLDEKMGGSKVFDQSSYKLKN